MDERVGIPSAEWGGGSCNRACERGTTSWIVRDRNHPAVGAQAGLLATNRYVNQARIGSHLKSRYGLPYVLVYRISGRKAIRRPDRQAMNLDKNFRAELARLDEQERELIAIRLKEDEADEAEARKRRIARDERFVAQMQEIAGTRVRLQTVIASLGGTEGLPAIGAASNRSARARKASGDVREGTVAAAILKALDEAGPAGLSGRAVNDAVEVAGFGIHSSEKVKAQLKREMRVRHDADKRWWYALNVDATAPDSTED